MGSTPIISTTLRNNVIGNRQGSYPCIMGSNPISATTFSFFTPLQEKAFRLLEGLFFVPFPVCEWRLQRFYFTLGTRCPPYFQTRYFQTRYFQSRGRVAFKHGGRILSNTLYVAVGLALSEFSEFSEFSEYSPLFKQFKHLIIENCIQVYWYTVYFLSHI